MSIFPSKQFNSVLTYLFSHLEESLVIAVIQFFEFAFSEKELAQSLQLHQSMISYYMKRTTNFVFSLASEGYIDLCNEETLDHLARFYPNGKVDYADTLMALGKKENITNDEYFLEDFF